MKLTEKFASKAQQRYFYAQAGKGGKHGKKWKNMAKEFSKKTDFDALPDRVTLEYVLREADETPNKAQVLNMAQEVLQGRGWKMVYRPTTNNTEDVYTSLVASKAPWTLKMIIRYANGMTAKTANDKYELSIKLRNEDNDNIDENTTVLVGYGPEAIAAAKSKLINVVDKLAKKTSQEPRSVVGLSARHHMKIRFTEDTTLEVYEREGSSAVSEQFHKGEEVEVSILDLTEDGIDVQFEDRSVASIPDTVYEEV